MDAITVRYIVSDASAAIAFYENHLGFRLQAHPAPGFAILSRNNLRLLLNEPGAGGAGMTLPDGSTPAPGGWCRIQIEVENLEVRVRDLRNAGARFRSEIVYGTGGDQILLEDPSGNPIELFQAKRGTDGADRVSPIPDGFRTVTPFFAVEDVAAYRDFLERAFGGRDVQVMRSADGVVRHAVIAIGDSRVMLSSAAEAYAAGPAAIHLYVPDVDGAHARAVGAGATSLREPADQFHGDRSAGVADPWGHQWWLATHVEDVSSDELERREREFRQG
jgi:uncharacterized glyoxalase superfamily protein PhnB